MLHLYVMTFASIEMVQVSPDDKQVLQNLLELYVYDFTEYMDFDLDEKGLFHYPLEPYWSSPNHYAFFIRVNDKLAGFVLVHPYHSKEDKLIYSIGEFFVMKKYRKKGVGSFIAQRVFDKFPGKWLIFESQKNFTAQAFWRKVIGNRTNGNFKEFIKDNKPHQEFSITE